MSHPSKHDGREQRRQTDTAKVRTPNLERFYRHRLPPITPGDFQFELDLLRPRDPALRLNTVDTLNWDDEKSVMTGSLSAYRPDPEDPGSLPITRGQLVRCRTLWGKHRYELWTMRCEAPQYELDTGQVTVNLKDDMAKLDAGGQDWWFRKTKHRQFGYTAGEVTREVGRRLGVKVRSVAKSTARFELKLRNATGLDVLKAAWGKEHDKSGRTFVIRMRNGKIEIVTLQRNTLLYVLGKQIQTAQITVKAGRKIPTTVLTGRGHTGKGNSSKKVSYTAYDRKVVRLLGYSHDTKDYGKVDSHADLRAQVKRDLAKGLRVNDSIQVTHQGIPFIERGDGVSLALPSEGYKGEQSFVFCTRANHNVQSGIYTTTFDFNQVDPFLKALRAQDKAVKARADKRKKRKRPKLYAHHH